MASDKHEETFRVIDRRLFNETGELRQDAIDQEKREAAKPATVPDATAKPADAANPAQTPTAAPAIPPSRAFQMLVDLISQNAAVYLGGYADPATGRPIVELDAARNIIDMLEALRDKTKGNLAPEDDRILVEVLSSLKMAFLEVSKAAAQAVRQNPTAIPASKLRAKP